MVKYYWVEWKFSFLFYSAFIVLSVVDCYIYWECVLQLLSVEHTSLTQIKFENIISNPWLTVLGQGILFF